MVRKVNKGNGGGKGRKKIRVGGEERLIGGRIMVFKSFMGGREKVQVDDQL